MVSSSQLAWRKFQHPGNPGSDGGQHLWLIAPRSTLETVVLY
jgi:hypothetical protein